MVGYKRITLFSLKQINAEGRESKASMGSKRVELLNCVSFYFYLYMLCGYSLAVGDEQHGSIHG